MILNLENKWPKSYHARYSFLASSFVTNNQLTLLRALACLEITVMASLLPTTATTLQHNRTISFSPLKLSIPITISFSTDRLKSSSGKCNAVFGDIPKDLLETTFHVDQFSVFQSVLTKFQNVTEDLSDIQRWGFVILAGLTWAYLTARPGVLVCAIDAFLLAPMQLLLDSLSGRRNLKRTDFLIGDKIGEGSFGIVYSGVLIPKNVDLQEWMQKNGRGKVTKLDVKSKDKVILKKVASRYSFIFQYYD